MRGFEENGLFLKDRLLTTNFGTPASATANAHSRPTTVLEAVLQTCASGRPTSKNDRLPTPARRRRAASSTRPPEQSPRASGSLGGAIRLSFPGHLAFRFAHP